MYLHRWQQVWLPQCCSCDAGVTVAVRGDSGSHLLDIIPGLLPCTYPHLARHERKNKKRIKAQYLCQGDGIGRKTMPGGKALSKSLTNLIITSKGDD